MADLHQGGLAALIVELFEAIKAIAIKAHYFAGFGYTIKCFGQLQQTYFVFDYFLFACHLTFLSLPLLASLMKCQIKF